MRYPFRLILVIFFAFIIITSVTAVAATNTVPPTRMVNQFFRFNVNDLKPSACSAVSLENLVTGSGILTGTESNDLILGSAGVDIINGLGGNDCILGGGGDDQITGDGDNDTCLGGSGLNDFEACEIVDP